MTSWKTVKTLLGQTDQLMINGTNQLMAQMINQLNKALLNLQKRATSMDEYRKAIVLKNSNLYTKESYEKRSRTLRIKESLIRLVAPIL